MVPAPQAEVSGPVVACWTGRQARALRVAARWSTDQVAARLNITSDVVAGWEGDPDTELPLPVQVGLDQALTVVDAAALTRFEHLTADARTSPGWRPCWSRYRSRA